MTHSFWDVEGHRIRAGTVLVFADIDTRCGWAENDENPERQYQALRVRFVAPATDAYGEPLPRAYSDEAVFYVDPYVVQTEGGSDE